MNKKIMIQLEGGKEIDLAEVIAESSVEQLKEMGFPIQDGKVNFTSLIQPAKSEKDLKVEGLKEAANFIKTLVLPERLHKQYGVEPVQLKQITTDSGSFGAAVPTALASAILEKKAKFAIIRSRAFAFELSGNFDLPVEGTGVTGYWISGEVDDSDANLVTASEPTLVKKSLTDHYLAALVKVSWKLLQTSDYNLVNFIASLAGKKLAETEETAFIAGSGTGQPKGIRSESLTSVAQEGAGLAYQDLVNLYFLLPAQYRQNAVFITSAMGAKAIVGLKDSQDRPIFAPGQPLDELFRKPLLESGDIPENLGTGQDTTEVYFGDPYYYWIKDGQALSMATQDVIERLQTKVLVYQAVDGKLVLTDAFVKLTGVKPAVES
ncbi:MAG TPA: phage major capsid protein [Candidatus Colwellbacteria bacterium]|nr:phage major capsid protein [Candidatus Colwellbacteria bacterium]